MIGIWIVLLMMVLYIIATRLTDKRIVAYRSTVNSMNLASNRKWEELIAQSKSIVNSLAFGGAFLIMALLFSGYSLVTMHIYGEGQLPERVFFIVAAFVSGVTLIFNRLSSMSIQTDLLYFQFRQKEELRLGLDFAQGGAENESDN